MPHSSGGGSHGGGTHGGGSHGGRSGNHISHHYFPGARRYRKHRPGHPDEYIYASSKPQKMGLFPIILLAVFGAIFGFGTFDSIKNDIPHKLDPVYVTPGTHIEDNIGVIDNEDDLEEALEEFEDVTGICPVVYTVYDEDWQDGYTDLESYAFDVYVDNYDDEQHFVIVYSIPEDQIADFNSGDLEVPDFSWEAIQGDETDPILTEGMFRRFSKLFHNSLENGDHPGSALTGAFGSITKSADDTLGIKSPMSIISLIMKCAPLLIVIVFFGFAFYVVIRQFIRDRDAEYEEVPMTPEAEQASFANTGTFATAEQAETARKVTKVAAPIILIISIVFILPFVLIGVMLLIAGIGMMSIEGSDGAFLTGFAVIWILLSGFAFAACLIAFFKLKKKNEARDYDDDYRPASKSDYDDDWDRSSRYDDYE